MKEKLPPLYNDLSDQGKCPATNEVFTEMSDHYKRYRKLHTDKDAFVCWTIMCLEVYLDGDGKGECKLIRDSWEEYMKFARVNRQKEGRLFKKRKRK